jgi:thioredoxin-related protein
MRLIKKRIISLLLLISFAHANHIRWQGDYKKALKEARDTHKDLMVLLIKNNCLECKKIVQNIFTNRPYIETLNKNFVSVIVNIDNRSSYPIEMYYSNDYPSLFFVNNEDETFIPPPLYLPQF